MPVKLFCCIPQSPTASMYPACEQNYSKLEKNIKGVINK